ncbi:hypothetical protein K490DRAFT_65813 [Saccharata proteae CBS 121410]|uniref:Basic proline-rich protein n=1 Tax=Saccharata proteae CBS 121410 TaxID=1314787 RepID=A0A9P4HXM7_9PEZI|nr:hypothetical protein K490DRAFT_65813 [Saccharata proteae CBS 121410]
MSSPAPLLARDRPSSLPAAPKQRQQQQQQDHNKSPSTSPKLPEATMQHFNDLCIEKRDEVPDLPALPAATRPETPRRSTDPSLPTLLQPSTSPRPRNRSPYSRSHLRSSSLTAPPMARAHSLPTPIGPIAGGNVGFASAPAPSSPMRSPRRVHSPFKLAEETYPHSASATSSASDIGIISENEELDIPPRPGHAHSLSLPTPDYLSNMHAAAALRPRRRPTNPLYQVASGGTSNASTRSPSPTHPSPTLSAAKFNESFPTSSPSYAYAPSYPSSTSSVPSTPTSTRSRSPSISSLETIPDSPDAEEAAIEADRIAKLEAAAREENEGEGTRRSSLDAPRQRNPGLGGFGLRDKRKRWSVCGAEKRGDLDLETIWEGE